MTQQKSVTLVISHTLDPEHGERYEQWLGKIMPVAAEFPGHLGAKRDSPGPPGRIYGASLFVLTPLNTSMPGRSQKRVANWSRKLRRCSMKAIARKCGPSPAFWFTPPAANVRQPLRWKQFLITLLVIFPSTNLVPWLTGMFLPSLRGSLLLHLINDACVVALVVWFWMPIVTRLFAGWLKKN